MVLYAVLLQIDPANENLVDQEFRASPAHRCRWPYLCSNGASSCVLRARELTFTTSVA